MTRLILTSSNSGERGLKQAGLADIVIPFGLRFVWGQLPTPVELESFLAARSTRHDTVGSHWLDFVYPRHLEEIAAIGLGLIELCARCETVELWIDPEPNAQLQLVWLLDYFRSHGETPSGLTLRQTDAAIGGRHPRQLAEWRPPAVQVTRNHMEAASRAWQAYRAPTPQAWFDLLDANLTVLPRLQQAVLELLEELPMRTTGLGATETRMIELVADGYLNPIALFPHHPHQQRKAYDFWEAGSLLEGLAESPAPAVSGLDGGPIDVQNYRSRHERYVRSRLSVTVLGKAILAQTEDFSRHNPVHRWWGGTELSNDRLWRWDPAIRDLIAP